MYNCVGCMFVRSGWQRSLSLQRHDSTRWDWVWDTLSCHKVITFNAYFIVDDCLYFAPLIELFIRPYLQMCRKMSYMPVCRHAGEILVVLTLF